MSNPKKVFLKEEAQALLSKGVNALADVVASTMGAQGRYVTIDRGRFGSLVTKDGVTVANEVIMEDPGENVGANMIRTAANATNEMAGDGTTTATVLARAIYNAGRKALGVGVNIADLRSGIQWAANDAVAVLKSISKPLETGDLQKITTISANNDVEMGKVIADAIAAVDGGVVTVEPSHTPVTHFEIIHGFRFDRGIVSPYFITDDMRDLAVLDEALVFVSTANLSSLDDILPLLKEVSDAHVPIIFIADGYGQEVLQTLAYNGQRQKGTLICAAVMCPGYGESKAKLAEDIAVLTGAQLITNEMLAISKPSMTFCGKAKKIISGKGTTTILEGYGEKAAVENRLAKLSLELEDPHISPYEVDQINDRISRIRGGVAVVRVGGLNEEEVMEKRARIEDAIHAAQSAMEEGVVPGGGLAYLYCIKNLESDKEHTKRRDEAIGIDIIIRALEAPMRQIVQNSGHEAGDAIAKAMSAFEDGKFGYGFNAATEQFSDLLADGIIDPTKVSRVALENAVSVALLLLTTDSVLVEAQYREDDPRIEKNTIPRPIMKKHR